MHFLPLTFSVFFMSFFEGVCDFGFAGVLLLLLFFGL